MLFNLNFANSTILSCLFFFYLIFELYFLIPLVILQIFNSTAELAMLIKIPTKEAKAKIVKHSAMAEAKTSKCYTTDLYQTLSLIFYIQKFEFYSFLFF